MRTEKQTVAQKRNWNILRLRGIRASLGNIAIQQSIDVSAACLEIDKILVTMGIESDVDRQNRENKKLLKEFS